MAAGYAEQARAAGAVGGRHASVRRDAEMSTASSVIARLATGVGLMAAAGVPLLNVYGTSQGIRLVLLAVVPSTVLSLAREVAAARGLRVVAAFRLLAVLLGVVASLILVPAGSAASGALTRRLRDALTGTWHRVLSVALPVPLSHPYADGVAIVLSLATAAVCSLTARRRAGQAIGVAVLVWAGAVCLGIGGQWGATVLGCPLAAAACLALLARVPSAGQGSQPVPDRDRAPGRNRPTGSAARRVSALSAAAVLLAASAAVIVGLPHGVARDPRDVAVPADRHPLEASPLALLSSRLRAPGQAAFVARGGSSDAGAGWLLLTYADYDGSQWQTPIQARDLPTAVPPRLPAGARYRDVLTLVSPQTLIPHNGTVVASNTAGLRYDPSAGSLVAPLPVNSASVDTIVESPTSAQLARATVPTGVSPELTAVPSCTPPAIARLVQQARTAGGLPDEQVVRLESAFRATPFVFDASAVPGSGCARLDQFLSARRGTSEQFASAFALAVRMLGLPARLAVGYGPGARGPGGATIVTNADARAWVQVEFTGAGWVDFFPTPSGHGAYSRPAEKQPALSHVRGAVAEGRNSTATSHGPTPTPPSRRSAGGALPAWLWALIGVVVLMMALLAPSVVRVMRRRRRLAAGQPGARVLQAWSTSLEPLRLGTLLTDDATFTSIAAMRFWGEPVQGSGRPTRQDRGRQLAAAVTELSRLAEAALYRSTSDDRAGTYDPASRAISLGKHVRRGAIRTLPIRQQIRLALRWN
ncbi:transglutaminase family protein [uncultured Jatrophihabitans sp.]|uniref:transglutaminase-like domain-containing protein n=1 Tax=uncultured Jatrophihabitans sp. TaxID=1610747 RepID=UPI0035CACC81